MTKTKSAQDIYHPLPQTRIRLAGEYLGAVDGGHHSDIETLTVGVDVFNADVMVGVIDANDSDVLIQGRFSPDAARALARVFMRAASRIDGKNPKI